MSQLSEVQSSVSAHCPSSAHGPPSVGSPPSGPTFSPPSVSLAPAAPASLPESTANGLFTVLLPQPATLLASHAPHAQRAANAVRERARRAAVPEATLRVCSLPPFAPRVACRTCSTPNNTPPPSRR